MRVKYVWDYLPLPAYTKLFIERVTFSRLTIIYLVFSIVHFFIQLGLQIRAFTTNVDAFNSLTNVVQSNGGASGGLPLFRDSVLHVCEWVPSNLNLQDGKCNVIWSLNTDRAQSQQDNVILSYSDSTTSTSASTAVEVSTTISPTVDSTSTTVSTIASSATTGIPSVSLSKTDTMVVIEIPTTSQRVPIVIQSITTTTQTTVASSSPPASISSSAAVTRATVARSSSLQVASTQSSESAITSTATRSQFPTPVSSAPVSQEDSDSNSDGGDDSDDEDEGEDSDDEDVGEDSDDEDEGEDSDDEDEGEDSDDDKIVGAPAKLSGRDVSSEGQINGISQQCLTTLSYPVSILGNTKREDVVFIAFQFWVLGMSVVALLNESIPHILASFVTHIMASAWGVFQIVHTANFRHEFNLLVTNGACVGVPLPVGQIFWNARRAAEFSSLALNILFLFISAFLSWRLFKLFGWQTFKRVGASLVINRIYKLVLILSITIQLSLFFIAVAVSLWIDRLINSVIGDLVDMRKLYIGTSILTLILLVPWLMTGWFGVRRELKVTMLIFLGLCLLYLGGWSVMFISTTFRWTFITWRFFSVMACASVLMTVACLILGVLCRLNFDRGLLRYLSSQEALPGDGFGIVTPEYDDIEKVDFPDFSSTEKPMPTFNATYVAPTNGQMFNNGPQFYHQAPPPGMIIPARALTRAPSDRSTNSEKSTSSWDSYYSYSHSRNNSLQYGTKRWIIE